VSDDVAWLDDQEERLWRTWVKVNAQIASTLQRELQDHSGLSISDLEVLIHLTDDPGGQVRVTDLAGLLQWERSRLSHHVRRMERRGLVLRAECPDDGRGALVVISVVGRKAIEHAAPGHVQTVRRVLFDALSPDQTACLADVLARLAAVHDRRSAPAVVARTGEAVVV
jgi:DNA-binding MarR family transcriptional regulator